MYSFRGGTASIAPVVALILGGSQALMARGGPGYQDSGGAVVQQTEGPDHGPLDRLLGLTVHDGLVDYLMIRDHHTPALTAYLDRMATVDPAKLTPAAGLAFCINIYNATIILAVTERLVADYSPARDSWAIFDEPLVRMAGRRLSLNEFEHEIIRPRYRDPRVHVALVCAAASCPPLLARAYRAGDLDRVLDDNLRRFVRDPVRNPIDRHGHKLRLSRIFEWYAEDFGGLDGVREIFARRLPYDPTGFSVEFVEYSWKLNMAPPRSGRWVRVRSEGVSLTADSAGHQPTRQARSGELLEVIAEQDGRLQVRMPQSQGSAWLSASLAAPYPNTRPTGEAVGGGLP